MNNVEILSSRPERIVHNYKNIKEKLLKTNATVWFNKICSSMSSAMATDMICWLSLLCFYHVLLCFEYISVYFLTMVSVRRNAWGNEEIYLYVVCANIGLKKM